MRFVKEKTGLERIRTKVSHKPNIKRGYMKSPTKREPSEDTKIRRDIHKKITDMIGENKSNIEIEIYLRNLYPDYAEYIAKMINDQFIKRNLNREEQNSNKEVGDER